MVADKLLSCLSGQSNSGHQQLSGALWAQVQMADETFNTGLVRGCGDDIRAAEKKAVQNEWMKKRR